IKKSRPKRTGLVSPFFGQLTVVDRDRLLANTAAIIDTFDKSIDCYLCCYPKATKFNLHDQRFCSKATYIVECLVAVARNAIA
ncbi:hypothetical protein, partial [Tychonema sp. BBK16]|uniref:hypothetical protein n=1 Tax=Tychonema sp. BBK16 TaxID=2699888 RepID=UPI001F1A7D12